MTTETKRSAGRPKVRPEQTQVTIAVDRTDLAFAESLVPGFDGASTLGVRHSRLDVLRSAIKRGLASLGAELNGSTKNA
jgi:hypothetical protein